MKIKLLAWGDYGCYTGFANVMSNIMRRITDIADIDVVGVNFDGRPTYDRDRFPGRVWPARHLMRTPHDDMWGMQKVIDLLREGDYDVLFVLADPFVADKAFGTILEMKEKYQKKFKIVYYFPLDAEPYSSWIRESVALADAPVAYSEFGYRCCVSAVPELEDKLAIIPHGVDTSEFYPVSDAHELRSLMTKGYDDKFLLLNVNRNTPRKDIPRSLMVLSELKDRGENVAMYLHMSPNDQGGNFNAVALRLGLQENVDYFYPRDLDAINGYPVNIMNYIYNASDCLITTSLGEGWGFSLTEAMACRLPVVAPAHSAIKEILADGRGFLTLAGSNNSLWRVIDQDNMVLRPLADVDDMADQIQEIIKNGANSEVEQAYHWVNNLNWDDLVEKKWKPLILDSCNGGYH